MRTFLTILFFAIGLMGRSTQIEAAELVMFEADGCAWCERWHQEIGVIYPKTPEGVTLPLRTVDANRDFPEDLKHVRGIFFTPTFVIMDGTHELGRIRGYPGEDFFWPMLEEVINQHHLVAPSPGTAATRTDIVPRACATSLC